jgi:hypothetical protein
MAQLTREEILGDAQRDVYRLLVFAAERKRVKLTDALINRAVKVVRVDAKELEQGLERELWKVRNALTDSVAPATPNSLRAMAEFAAERTKPWFKRRSEPALAERWARHWMVVTLAFLLVLQVYALVGSSIVNETSRLLDEIDRAKHERATLSLVMAAGGTSKPESLDEINAKLKDLGQRLAAETHLAAEWNSIWRSAWKIFPQGRTLTPAPSAPEGIARMAMVDQQAARAAIDALSTYFLPLLYGLLGAAAFILRRLADQIAESTFSGASQARYRIRLALGALFGVTATLLLEAATGVDEKLRLSGLAVAFIAGYSVEVVVSLFDYWIDRIRSGLRPSEGSDGSSPSSPNSAAAADRASTQ